MYCSLEQAPSRIQAMAETWEAGRAAHVRALRDKRRHLMSEAEALAKERGLGPDGDLSAKQLGAVNSKIIAMKRIDRQLSHEVNRRCQQAR
jgi:hypothetical protein